MTAQSGLCIRLKTHECRGVNDRVSVPAPFKEWAREPQRKDFENVIAFRSCDLPDSPGGGGLSPCIMGTCLLITYLDFYIWKGRPLLFSWGEQLAACMLGWYLATSRAWTPTSQKGWPQRALLIISPSSGSYWIELCKNGFIFAKTLQYFLQCTILLNTLSSKDNDPLFGKWYAHTQLCLQIEALWSYWSSQVW